MIKKLRSWVTSHLILTIIILSGVLRLTALDRVPPALNWDEVSMGYSAYSLMQTGRDEWGQWMPILFRSYGEWKSPVYIYLLVPFIKIFGLNAWGVRLPAALAGIACIYLTYLIGRKLYSEQVGVWAALFLAVSPWHLMLSRPGFEAGVALMLILWGIYLALAGKIVWAALPFGLALHTYHSAKFVVPVVITYLVLMEWKKHTSKKIICAAIILAVCAFPIALDLASGKSQKRYAQVGITTDAELVERFYHYRETFPLGKTASKFIINKATFVLAKGFSNWTSYLSPHFLLGSESIRAQHSIPFRGVLYLTECVLMLYGAIIVIRQQRGSGRYLPFLAIGIALVPPALTKDAYHVLRSILTLPWWQMLAAVGMVSLSTNSKFRRLYTLNLLLLTCEVVSFLLMYFTWYPRAFARDWQYGYREVAQFIQKHESEYTHITMTKAYGEPHIFLAFYNAWDPTWYQAENRKLLEYESRGYPWLDQLPAYSLGKYSFRDMNWALDNTKKGELFVGKADDFYADTIKLEEIVFPDQTGAFTIVTGK